MPRSGRRSLLRVCAFVVTAALTALPAAADEIWVAPTSQSDVGGLGVASNVVWPVTPRSGVRLAWSIPDNLQTFQGAKLVLVSDVVLASTTVNVLVCAAANSQAVTGSCSSTPVPHVVSVAANTLREVDISAALAPFIGAAGQRHLAVIAYTPTLTTTTHLVGLRFTYAPKPPTGVATLGANTFTGTQTATAFVGDGSGLTNLPAPSGVAGLGANTFSGTQTAPAFVGDGTGVSNVNANTLDGLDSTAFASAVHGHDVTQVTGAARLSGGNVLAGVQTLNAGNLDLDASTATSGNITKDGDRFIHNFGVMSTFVGVDAGSLSNSGQSNTGVGARALRRLTSGVSNTAFGVEALHNNRDGSANTGVGVQALTNNMSGNGNTAIGREALWSNVAGNTNTALGSDALRSSTDACCNTAVGYSALNSTTIGQENTAVGHSALLENESGHFNVALGVAALYSNTAGSDNTAVGYSALSRSTGIDNIAIGSFAGYDSTTGSGNVYLGKDVRGIAGESNAMYLGNVGTQTKTTIAGVRGTAVTGAEMVVVDADGRFGSEPVPVSGGGDITAVAANTGLTGGGLSGDVGLALDTVYTDARYASIAHGHNVSVISGAATLGANSFTGSQTIASGNLSLDASTPTTGNIFKGGQLFVHSPGVANTFVGASAGNTATTGVGQNSAFGSGALAGLTSGDSNTAIGASALSQNNQGNLNTAVGRNALRVNTTGGGNTVAGAFALNVNTTGDANTASGYFAMASNTTGSQNTAIGQSALSSNTTASGSTAIGIGSLQSNTGPNNVAIGRQAGRDATSGSSNIYVGADVFGVAGESNAMYLGKVGTQTKTVIAGVRGTAVSGAEMVVVDTNGRLGSAPVPVGGSGDITGVAANTGLTGGGLSGDVGLALDTSFTDGRYASIAHGHTVSAISGAATTGVNTFTGTQTISGGNLSVGDSTSTSGNLIKNGNRYLHSFGDNSNVFLGSLAGNFSLVPGANANVGIGNAALLNLTSGYHNVGQGSGTLLFTTTGFQNTALGGSALFNNTSGSNNVAVGTGAGMNATTGSNNIYLGAFIDGTAAESNAMYLGRVGTQTKTVIAGVRGTPLSGGEMVVVDANGRLGSAPVPVGGGGDITGVAAGTGLAGGGIAGDVGLTLDTAYTDARYAAFAHGHNVSAIGGAATLGANTFTNAQTINGDLNLAGVLNRNGSRFIHDSGSGNTFVGRDAGNFTVSGFGINTGVGEQALFRLTSGYYNTAVGTSSLANTTIGQDNTAMGAVALAGNTIGSYNTAHGARALQFSTTGEYNSAFGAYALQHNTTGSGNTAYGFQALFSQTTGVSNTAVGQNAFEFLASGSMNVAVGVGAGQLLTTGSNNIYLGTAVQGVANESNTMYLGKVGTQAKTIMAGVRGITTGANDAVPVVIDSNGQLGTISSSARYKEDIHDLGATSRRLFNLRPVKFRYTQPFTGGIKPVQFGLIAEEVAQVFPELAVLNADGQPETVKYQDLSVLLLNEVQRQQETIDRQARELDAERQRVDALERKLQLLLERVGGIN